jgi:hypothetical protein
MTSERDALQGLVDHLAEEISTPAHRDPWTEVQTWVTLLLPALTDAGLLWEYTGASSEGVMLDDGETLGGFWLLDPASGLFVGLEDADEVQGPWIAKLREQINGASRAQLRLYAAWAHAAMHR